MGYDRIILRFDPYLRAVDEGLKVAIFNFITELETHEAQLGYRVRERKIVDRKKFQQAIEALLSNLIIAHKQSSKTLLNIPLSNTVLRGVARYRPYVYGKHFRDLIALLENLGLIETVTKGYYVREWRRREITTIRPTRKLLKAFPPITATDSSYSFIRIEPPEAIVLKDREGCLLDYSDTALTKRWRKEMRVINSHLCNAPIELVSKNVLLDESGFLVRQDARRLRRIFNNGDWSQGGRLYGGFWETMDRDLRLDMIRIDGEPIANVDFKQFNLRLAYALAKTKSPKGDLYDVTGQDATRANWPALREGRKKLANAMINGSASLKRWPGLTLDDRTELASCFPKNTTARMAFEDIRIRHSAIKDYFESAQGLAFMRIESDILVATILSLMKRGITALPLHDAVLVQRRHKMAAKVAMQRESKRRIGTVIAAEIETSNN